MKLKSLLTLGMVATMAFGGMAQTTPSKPDVARLKGKIMKHRKPRPFYSGRSSIVGVSGNFEYLEEIGLSSKIFRNPVNIATKLECPADISKHQYTDDEIQKVIDQLNKEQVGLKILTYIYTDDQGNLSEDRLADRSLRNTRRDEAELMTESEIGFDARSKEDVVPLLQNNYVFLTTRCAAGTAFMAFKADMNQETLFDVWKVWDKGAAALSEIDVPLLFVGSGYIPDQSEAEAQSHIARQHLAKNVPAMAVRGKVLGRAPLRADFGLNSGAQKGDRVEIYRAMLDKDGNMVSKRISTARIGDMDDNTAYLFPIAGNKGSRKNGDMAVVVPDKRMGIYFEPTWSPHVWGFDATWSWTNFVTKYGITGGLLGNLGFAMTDKPSENWVMSNAGGVLPYEKGDEDKYTCFKSPMFFHLGLGYGVSYTIAGLVEFNPFAMVQFEMAYMMDRNTGKSIVNSNVQTKDILAPSVRIPVGLNVFFNLGYKFQIGVSGGWAYTYGIKDEKDYYKSYQPVKEACDYMGAKRTGVFLGVGLKWRF